MIHTRPLPMGGVTLTAAIIRLGEDGPYIYHNSAHAAVNVDDVEINRGGDLELRTIQAVGPVVTTGCDADETLVLRGVAAGVSGGVGLSLIRLADETGRLNLNRADHYRRVAGRYSNLWFYTINLPR